MRSEEPHCLDCGTPAPGKFCPECGQETKDRVLPVGELFKDVTEEFLKVDARVVRTLRPLLLQPGFLTLEYLAGRRTRYVPPFKLYFFITAIWFLLFAVTGMDRQILNAGKPAASSPPAAASPKVDPAEVAFQQASDRGLKWYFDNQSFIGFLLVPAIAALIGRLYRKSQKLFIEHLVFVVHLASFVFLVGLLLFLPLPEAWLDGIFEVACAVYTFIALRRVYGEGVLRTVIKELALAVGVLGLNLLVIIGASVVFAIRG